MFINKVDTMPTTTTTTGNAIDYKQYLKKTWIRNTDTNFPDGSFINDYKLDQEINDSGNNKDIGTVTNYLSSKF